MARPSTPRPTDAELAVLRVLWQDGPNTVRHVHRSLNAARDVGYTATLVLMQSMAAKGLLDRDESRRSHVYKARLAEDETQRNLLRDLLRRAFGGSARKLFVHAIDVAKPSPRELNEIRALLDAHRQKGRRK